MDGERISYMQDEDEDEEVAHLTESLIGSFLRGIHGTQDDFEDNSNDMGRGEWNQTENAGFVCPICLDSWTSGGEHQVCCLPCGHIYGLSCIEKWFRICNNSGKCPQCKLKYNLKDVRKLYASDVVIANEESQKRIQYLNAKCDSLESKVRILTAKQDEFYKREAGLLLEVEKLKGLLERIQYLNAKCDSLENKGRILTAKQDEFYKREASLLLEVEKLKGLLEIKLEDKGKCWWSKTCLRPR